MMLLLLFWSLLNAGSVFEVSGAEYPPKGFLYGKESQHQHHLAIKIQSYNSIALTVPVMQFDFLPTASRFKSPIFQLVENSFSYERPVWSNGREYLYFIHNPSDHEAPHGTWLIGREIGVDSGYAFLKPLRHALIPLGLDQDGGAGWYFLNNHSWTQVKNMTLSTSSAVDSLVYYEVEYLTEQSALTSSILFVSPPSRNSEVLTALRLSSSTVVTSPSSDLSNTPSSMQSLGYD
jgi:hypothetical protein